MAVALEAGFLFHVFPCIFRRSGLFLLLTGPQLGSPAEPPHKMGCGV